MNGPVLLAFAVLIGVAVGELWFAIVRWRRIQERSATEAQRLSAATRSLSRREED